MDVIVVFKFLDEGENLGGGFWVGCGGGILWFVKEAAGGGDELGGAEGFIDCIEFVGRADDFGGVVVEGADIVSSCFEGYFESGVGVGFFEEEHAVAFEHPSDRVGATEIAAVFGEEVTDFSSGAVFIVGGGFDEEGDTAWGIAFVHNFFDGAAAFEFAGAFEDGAIDVFDGHRFGTGGGDGGTESGVEAWVAT